MTSHDNSLRTVKALLKLVDEHNLDYLEVNGIKIQKSKHYISDPLPSFSSSAPKPKSDIPLSMNDVELSQEERWYYGLPKT